MNIIKKLIGVINNKFKVIKEEIDRVANHPDSSEVIHSYLNKQHAAMERAKNSLRAVLCKVRRNKRETPGPNRMLPPVAAETGKSGQAPGPSGTPKPVQTDGSGETPGPSNASGTVNASRPSGVASAHTQKGKHSTYIPPHVENARVPG